MDRKEEPLPVSESGKAQEQSVTAVKTSGRMSILYRIGVETYRVFMRNDMNVFSGYTTLYILMAIVPFFTLAAGSIYFLPEEYLKAITDMFVSLFPNIPQMKDFANSLLVRINPQAGTIVVSVSLIIMIWSASNGVSALQLGLMRISENEQPLVKRRVSAMVYTILFIFLIPSLLIFRVLRTSLMNFGQSISDLFHMPEIYDAFVTVLEDGHLITAVGIAFIVLLTYTQLQGRSHRLRQQLPGAVFTTILWIMFSALFEWFMSEFWSASSLYGSLASIFLTALWLKIIITILFIGASLNEALFLYTHDKLDMDLY